MWDEGPFMLIAVPNRVTREGSRPGLSFHSTTPTFLICNGGSLVLQRKANGCSKIASCLFVWHGNSLQNIAFLRAKIAQFSQKSMVAPSTRHDHLDMASTISHFWGVESPFPYYQDSPGYRRSARTPEPQHDLYPGGDPSDREETPTDE